MADNLSPDSRRRVQKSLSLCTKCRLKLDALADAGLDVADRYDRLDRLQRANERLLSLDDPARESK